MKKYFKDLNIIRLIACIAVLLYHLNILKGGYLAVCTFFVLTGYLSCISAFRKEKFSLKEYYKNRLFKIYLPLVIVVFISIGIISFLPNIFWFNLKPETTSVLLGYNNFWQLNANLDYFARHVDSPFMHFWYIGILLQFDLVFPFIYLGLEKLGDYVKKYIPCLFTGFFAIVFALYFYISSKDTNIMVVYYNTFTRIFSILFGLTLGFIHHYYGILINKKIQKMKLRKVIFYVYLLLLLLSFILISSTSEYFSIAMIIVSLISMRLIDYATLDSTNRLNPFDKVVKSLSDISYEIYLIQYPLIFFFQNNSLKILLVISLTIVLAYLLHYALNGKQKILKYSLLVILLSFSAFGGYQYIKAEDHTKEMKDLENQLAANEELSKKNQEKYASEIKKEEETWATTLADLKTSESKLKEMVLDLPVIGIGDSVMLGAYANILAMFPNSYVDAKISRTAYEVASIVSDLKRRNMLGNPVVINLGANGDCSKSCKVDIMQSLGDREVFWLNTTNLDYVNKNLVEFAKDYSNLHIIDWKSISRGHSEYFYADGIHLTPSGRKVYTDTIYEAIYNVYLDKFNAKKAEIIKQHEEEQNNKISFYGNDLLLNAFDSIHENYINAKFVVEKDLDLDKILDKKDQMTHKLVFVFDKTVEIDKIKNLISNLSDHEIYIVSTNDKISEMSEENVKILDFSKEIIENPNYLMADGIHLTKEGNDNLSLKIKEFLN